jgi:hypothetical protein
MREEKNDWQTHKDSNTKARLDKRAGPQGIRRMRIVKVEQRRQRSKERQGGRERQLG